MLTEWRVPKTIQWLVNLFAVYLIIFTAFRIAIVLFFKPVELSTMDLLPSFWLGLKYDLRWISILLFPIAVSSMFKKLNPFYSQKTKNFWSIYLAIITLFVLVIYGADFAQFSTAHARFNADNMPAVKEYRNRLNYIWRNYPIIWISIGVIGAAIMLLLTFARQRDYIEGRNRHIHKFSFRRRWHAIGCLVLGFFIYGFFTAKPLRLDRAFQFDNSFKTNLALNPMQNYFTTRRIKKEKEKSLLLEQKSY